MVLLLLGQVALFPSPKNQLRRARLSKSVTQRMTIRWKEMLPLQVLRKEQNLAKLQRYAKVLYMFIICIKKYHEGCQGGKQVISKSDAHPCQPAQDYQERCSSVLHCYLHG